MKRMTFEISGRELDLLASRLSQSIKMVDPRDSLKICDVLESVWESMDKAKRELIEMIRER